MPTDTELPKQELLIKLLKMTTAEDNVALVAIRKANALLDAAGWDWERLINGKIRIIEDPFKNLGTPAAQAPRPNGAGYAAQSAPPPRQPPIRPSVSTTWPLGIQPNKYANYCYCCGIEVLTNAGVIFKPITHNARASADWKVACLSCNGDKTRQGADVATYAAAKQRAKRGRHNVTDLA